MARHARVARRLGRHRCAPRNEQVRALRVRERHAAVAAGFVSVVGVEVRHAVLERAVGGVQAGDGELREGVGDGEGEAGGDGDGGGARV